METHSYHLNNTPFRYYIILPFHYVELFHPMGGHIHHNIQCLWVSFILSDNLYHIYTDIDFLVYPSLDSFHLSLLMLFHKLRSCDILNIHLLNYHYLNIVLHVMYLHLLYIGQCSFHGLLQFLVLPILK